jgi:hypothetical protein
MARLMQRRSDCQLAIILWVMSDGATALGDIDTNDILGAPGGSISNGGLGSNIDVLATDDRGGSLTMGNNEGVQDMGSGVLGGAMGSRGILTSASNLRCVIMGACIRGSLNGLLLGG